MPQELNATDLSHAKNLLTSQGPSGMYDFLASKGYKYPTLANGVARGNSIAGVVGFSRISSPNWQCASLGGQTAKTTKLI